LVECVPNFSEGRDLTKVQFLADAIGSAGGVMLLDVHSDPDHNRSVITFAGSPEAVVEAAVRGAGVAAETIDLTRHQGVHPRIGALDVLPFVPLAGISLEECIALAVQAAEEIWRRHGVPAYLYGAAARRPDRQNLAAIRHGQFERLCEAVLTSPERRPDIGGPALHPTAGAVAAGVRRILVAFNVQLDTADVAVAREIASRIRTVSGGRPELRAMGVYLASRRQAQVSMNLTDFEITPPYRAFAAVQAETERLGVGIAGAEIVGLVPRKALEHPPGAALPLADIDKRRILENRLAECGWSATIVSSARLD
jgi:glutamate formiminotransferase